MPQSNVHAYHTIYAVHSEGGQCAEACINHLPAYDNDCNYDEHGEMMMMRWRITTMTIRRTDDDDNADEKNYFTVCDYAH